MFLDPARLTETAERLTARGIDVLRVGYADLTGAERGRDLLVTHLPRAAAGGVAFCKSVFATSPMGDVIPIDGGIGDGLPDVIAVPDLDTLHDEPWEDGVAHVIADIHDADGSSCETSPRNVLKRVVGEFHALGLDPVVGPELEFYVLEKDGAGGWRRYGEATGNVYVTGRKGDPQNILIRKLRQLDGYGLDVVAANHEFSSGQFEINLWHSGALDAADRAFRFKTAVKELSRMEDRLATFMAKPFNDEGGSGFHLHFSALDQQGGNAFSGEDGLSKLAESAIAGIIAHAPALAALNNPTVNSYKRFGPDTLAPWLIDWGLDNRSAMIRIPPERGGATRLELRLGDATANPYLAIAGMLAAALLGIRDALAPPPPLAGYGYDRSRAELLPQHLGTALDALESDTAFGALLGPQFVKTFLDYKRNELERFHRHVTDWEFREYSYHL